MKKPSFRWCSAAATFTAFVAAIATAVVLAAPRPPRRRVVVRARARPALRPWRKVVKRSLVVKPIPRARVVPVTANSPVVVVNTEPSEQGAESAAATESAAPVKPSDTSENFAGATAYAVDRVADGGLTVVLKANGRETQVRMIGVAPMRIARPARSPGPAGDGGKAHPASGHFLTNMLKGESVYIAYDSVVSENDEDGKYVAYLRRLPDGLLINLEAVRQGFCVVDAAYDFDQKQTFLHYQAKARENGKGIWGMMKRGGPRRGRPGRPAKPRDASH